MNAHRQVGLSLIEVMVALVISSILILGVTDLFNSSFMSGRSNSELAQIQENGRLAMEVIGSDIRLAGLSTCLSKLNPGAEPLENALVLGGNQKGLTLKYVDPDSCRNNSPNELTITYTFDGTELKKDGQPLLSDVDGSFTLLPNNSTPELANAVLITIEVKSKDSNFKSRNFSSIYELKNRPIARN